MEKKVIEFLSKLPSSKKDLGLSDSEFNHLKEMINSSGQEVVYDRASNTWNIKSDNGSNGLEKVVSDLFTKRGITQDEAKRLITLITQPDTSSQRYQEFKLDIPDKHIKYGVISDTHMGHNMYRPDVLEHAVKRFDKEKVDFILHTGDILEGMSGRDGHVYELNKIGATNQLEYGVSELSKFKQPMYGITATNSHDGWFSSKANAGFEVGPELERRLDNFKFIGYDEVDVTTDGGGKIRLLHPGGGTAYALSYMQQKYINSLTGGDKPNVIHSGHHHKLLYMFYRNIHAFEAGALQAQTNFMKKKGTPSMVGYTLIDLYLDKSGGVHSIKPEFTTFYDNRVDSIKL